jgi:hypothetical protein
MSIEKRFQEYFEALERSGNKDRCWICCRTPADVKRFFGFEEDGTPLEAAQFGIEDVEPGEQDVMSYRGVRPVCAICQLNMDAISALDEKHLLLSLLDQMETHRAELWPGDG